MSTDERSDSHTPDRDRRSFPTMLAPTTFGIMLLAWALISIWVVLRVRPAGGVVTGGVSGFPADQLQYMSWIREEGSHGLASNLFQLEATPHDFLHPMFLVSGVLWRLGLPIQLSYLLWLPIVAGLLVVGAWAVITRLLTTASGRTAALAIALFFVSPVLPIARLFDGLHRYTSYSLADVVAAEADPAYLVWGYLPSIMSIACVALCLTLVGGLERRVEAPRKPAVRAVGAFLAAMLASWLHPWQGETLLVVLVVCAVVQRLHGERISILLPAVGGAFLPLLYYAALARWDPAWARSSEVNKAFPFLPWWVLVAGLLPLALPAAAGVRARLPHGILETAVVAWPLASLLVYFALAPSFRYHAFEGISIPLAVLAVRGWQRIFGTPGVLQRTAAVAAVASLIVPGQLHFANYLRKQAYASLPYVLTKSEAEALRAVSGSDRRGGVLAPMPLGAAVPAFTGRRTWVGHGSWSPDFVERTTQADMLFNGRMSAAEVQQLVDSSGATFLVSSCTNHADLRDSLGQRLARVQHFGCATVYVLNRHSTNSSNS